MKYIHIKNLEKHHPKYRDRILMWGKFYFNMIQGDPEFEMISSEIDKWRFVALTMLELQAKQPIPLSEAYLQRKGFDLKKRPISLTLKMLHNFIVICTEETKGDYKSVDPIIEKNRKEEKRVEESIYPFGSKFMYVTKDFFEKLKITYKHVNLPFEFSKMEGWLLINKSKREKYTNWQRFIIHWLNGIDRPPEKPKVEIKEEKPKKVDPIEKKKVSDLIHKTAEKMRNKDKPTQTSKEKGG